MMRRSDFSYELPASLIAQAPLPVRSDSRLLCLDPGSHECADRMMRELPALLHPGDLLVFNDTRVLPARLSGKKETGGNLEILIERLTGPGRVLAQIRAGKGLRPGARLWLEGDIQAEVLRRDRGFYELRLDDARPVAEILETFGAMPLPPYISRPAIDEDRERYQTVFAARDGAVAAPTAGLHFDRDLLDRLDRAGITTTGITLHVGAGTFQPVRGEDLAAHRMHVERLEVSPDACERIRATRETGGRIVAIGTTVVRALETASLHGSLEPFDGETDLFITPGYRFKAVDALITNFHMPHSTLLMLVCAFAGTRRVLAAYEHGVRERYRFFSYGDAMLMPRMDR